jgi:hypothetical protein
MSFVTVAPELVGQAAGQLENIGSALSSAHAAAAIPTTSLAVAAGDEVSAAIASLFSTHAQHYQALNAQAAAFHSQFTNLLNAGAGSYLSAEIANTQAAGTGGIGQFLGGGLLSVYNGASNQYLELPLDAAGSVITATGALGQGGQAYFTALQAGNSTAATAALANIPPSVWNAFLYGQYPVSIVVGMGSGGGPGPSAIPTGSLLSLKVAWYTWQTHRSQPVATSRARRNRLGTRASRGPQGRPTASRQ